ncbi:MAG: manganese efflux pump [Candidatus Aminicenantes bacterium]|nr:manganese efflux pump [Candidatus Aminicenantes bacterium]
MDIITLILIAMGLSMDSFAVSVVNGFSIKDLTLKRVLFISGSFAIFQTLMPVLGWFAGGTIEAYIRSTDHWIAFAILLYLGVRMIYISNSKGNLSTSNETSVSTILTQSFATSIDALAVGLSFAVLKVDIIRPVIIIGITTFIFSIAGLYAGKCSGKKLKRSSEIVGGIILILIGVRVLIEHLFINH